MASLWQWQELAYQTKFSDWVMLSEYSNLSNDNSGLSLHQEEISEHLKASFHSCASSLQEQEISNNPTRRRQYKFKSVITFKTLMTKSLAHP